jgi:hypothetical protein
MVHPWRALRARIIPSRRRCNVYYDVSLRAFTCPIQCLTYLQQPFVGRYCRFYFWTPVGLPHSTPSSACPHPRPPASPTQVACRFSRRFYHWCLYRLLLLELACTCRRWCQSRLGLDTRRIRSGCRYQFSGAEREGNITRCRLCGFTYRWLGGFDRYQHRFRRRDGHYGSIR